MGPRTKLMATKYFLDISFVRGSIRPGMVLNFRKRPQGKMGKPRSSVELKKSNYIIRLFSGLCLYAVYFSVIDATRGSGPEEDDVL